MAGDVPIQSDWTADVIGPIEALLERWQLRGDTEALQTLLPAWRANAGLTDDWFAVLAALAAVESAHLPRDEADVVRSVSSELDRILTHRAQ